MMHNNIHRHRPLILRISFLIALGLVLWAFQWKAPVQEPHASPPAIEPPTIFITERTTIAEKVPTPEPLQEAPIVHPNPEIKVVPNAQKTPKMPAPKAPTWQEPTVVAPPNVEEPKIETPYRIVKQMPEFPGGIEAFYRYLSKAPYPKVDYELGLEGVLYLQFVVRADGSVDDVVVLRGGTPRMQEAAIQHLMNSPKWSPGVHQGRKVPVYYQGKIIFKLR